MSQRCPSQRAKVATDHAECLANAIAPLVSGLATERPALSISVSEYPHDAGTHAFHRPHDGDISIVLIVKCSQYPETVKVYVPALPFAKNQSWH
jgi:hypothetical protein